MQLVGDIPLSFGNLTELVHLDLTRNELTGSLTRSGLPTLDKLENLYLARNRFLGRVPMFLIEMKSLKRVNLAQNSYLKFPPARIGKLGLRSKGWFKYNKVDGRLLWEI